MIHQYFYAMTEELVRDGFIGTTPGATMTKAAWQKKISAYTEAKDKFESDGRNLLIARAAVQSGFASSAQVSLVQDAFSAELQPDANGSAFSCTLILILEKKTTKKLCNTP